MSRHIDEEAEALRLQRAMERQGKSGGVSPRKYGAAAVQDGAPTLSMAPVKATTPEWKRKERQRQMETEAQEKERLRFERERFKVSGRTTARARAP